MLRYADLRALRPGSDPRPPSREITLHLTGNMERFIWGFDGKKFSEAEPIVLQRGERVRFVLINDTMMEHPMHLHGMWSELENGHGDYRPSSTRSTSSRAKSSVFSSPPTSPAAGPFTAIFSTTWRSACSGRCACHEHPAHLPFAAGLVAVPVPAAAQTPATKRPVHLPGMDAGAMPPVMDQGIFAHAIFNQLEGRWNGSNPEFRWEGQGWVGTDYDKLWIKSEGTLSKGARR